MKARVRQLQQLVAVFLKAGKTLRLYSEEHRFFSRFADEFESRLAEQHAIDEALTFEITPTAIQWDGNLVFENRDQRENLALKLYRDGVRLLQFRRGATAEEVRDFVALIAREGERSGGSQDLSVLFWEADFKHIHIAVAETFVEYDEEATETLRRLEVDFGEFEREFGIVARSESDAELERLKASFDQTMTSVAAGGAVGVTSNAGFQGEGGDSFYEPVAYESHGVDAEEARLRGDPAFRGPVVDDDPNLPALPPEAYDDYAMELVYADLHGLEQAYTSFEEIGGVLAHVLEAETDQEELFAVLRNLDDALSPLLATAAVGPLNAILRRLALLQQRETAAGSFRAAALTEFLTKIGRLERLQSLARAINEDWVPALRGELFTFISLQHPDNLEQLMGFLSQLLPEEPRNVVTEALILLAGRTPALFLDAVLHGNWHSVSDGIRALGLIADPVALERVAIAFERPEASVRLQVIETLKTQQTQRVQDLMLRALKDEDGGVRLSSLRYCAIHGLKDSLPIIIETVGKRDFDERPFDERRGWHMTLGMLGGRDVLAEFQQVAEQANRRSDHGPKVHLALLTIKSVRETAARQWLTEFAGRANGEVKLLAHKVLAGNR